MKKMQNLVSAVSLSTAMFKKIEKTVFSDFRASYDSEREHAIDLSYVLHYVKDIDKNADMYVKRILDSVGAERSDVSNDIAKTASSTNIRKTFEKIAASIGENKTEKEIKDFLPIFLQSVYDADDSKAESLILRGFELTSYSEKESVEDNAPGM